MLGLLSAGDLGCLPSGLASKVIAWPSETRGREISQAFSNLTSFPGVIVGAIDGTHTCIPIKAPHDFPDTYINRKSFHSVQLQAVAYVMIEWYSLIAFQGIQDQYMMPEFMLCLTWTNGQ